MNVLTGNTQDLLALVAKIGSICLRTQTTFVARYLCHSLPIKNKINTIIRKITCIFTETSTRIY
jgi:hypothetical protein